MSQTNSSSEANNLGPKELGYFERPKYSINQLSGIIIGIFAIEIVLILILKYSGCFGFSNIVSKFFHKDEDEKSELTEELPKA